MFMREHSIPLRVCTNTAENRYQNKEAKFEFRLRLQLSVGVVYAGGHSIAPKTTSANAASASP